MDMISVYRYDILPTNSIRLLRLGGTASPHILKTVDIANAPAYYGLSYAWGVPTVDVPLQLDGHTLYVSSHLADAIHQLRNLTGDDLGSESHIEWLWIDKICINQSDPSERANQVQLMDRVYSRAVKTLIWLGPDDADQSCSGAWELIDQIYAVFRRETPHAKSVADIPFRLYSDEHHSASGLPPWNHQGWHHLRALFKLPWFTRTWIIQEVTLSSVDPIILHGQQRYSWDRLGWAASWLRRSGYLRLKQIPNNLQNVDTISNIKRYAGKWRLDALLVVTSIKCHATDQRDKVFGLLGMAAESRDSICQAALRPDYELDVAAVYTKTARFFLERYKSLSILTRASGVPGDLLRTQRSHQIDLLPSWVPNWCDFSVVEREVAKTLSWIFYPGTANAGSIGFPEHYHASAGAAIELHESQDPSVLRLGGLKADVITKTVSFNGKELESGQYARDTSLLRLWEAALPYFPDGASLTDSIASWIRTTTADHHLLAGRTAEQILKDGSAYLYTLLRRSNCAESRVDYLTTTDSMIDLLSRLSQGGNGETFAALANNFCLNRTFFVTQEGRMGIGPTGTQRGDVVYVLFGGQVPYILRAYGEGFLFVGESYIHGLMGGEAVEAWRRNELTIEILELY